MNSIFNSGHTACAGCGQSLAARLVLEAAGPSTIIVNNTGCLEVFSTAYPQTAWGVSFVHSLFENCAAVASGVEGALKYLVQKIRLMLLPRVETAAPRISVCRRYPECLSAGMIFFMYVTIMKLI